MRLPRARASAGVSMGGQSSVEQAQAVIDYNLDRLFL
jgi:hypothetical protein